MDFMMFMGEDGGDLAGAEPGGVRQQNFHFAVDLLYEWCFMALCE